MTKELRTMTMEVEIRKSENEPDSRTIQGYAVKWNELSETLGWGVKFKEKFSKGAFTESLKEEHQRGLWNHNPDYLLGNTKSKTLRLQEDDVGLRFEIDLPSNSWGNDVRESVKRGDVTGVSFGFSVKDENWDDTNENNIIRTITKAKLFEISPTPNPAYTQSEVSLRSIDEVYKNYNDSKVINKNNMNEQLKMLRTLRKKLY